MVITVANSVNIGVRLKDSVQGIWRAVSMVFTQNLIVLFDRFFTVQSLSLVVDISLDIIFPQRRVHSLRSV